MSEVEEIIAEIREYRNRMMNKSELQPGDITKEELCRELAVSEETLRKIMNNLISDGKFTRHLVRNQNGQRVTVYRRVGV